MNKKDYIKIRDNEEVPLSLFYEYWKEVKPSNYQNFTFEEFSKVFPVYLKNEGVPVNTPNGVKIISYQASIGKIFNHFNKKFNL